MIYISILACLYIFVLIMYIPKQDCTHQTLAKCNTDFLKSMSRSRAPKLLVVRARVSEINGNNEICVASTNKLRRPDL